MTYPSFNILAALPRYLKHLEVANQVIAENISNVRTPGYKAQMVLQPTFNDYLNSSPAKALRVTSSQHISLPSTHEQAFIRQLQEGEEKLNGNNVSLEREVAKLTKQQIEYNQVTTVYKKLYELMNIAIKGRSL